MTRGGRRWSGGNTPRVRWQKSRIKRGDRRFRMDRLLAMELLFVKHTPRFMITVTSLLVCVYFVYFDALFR
jgi:hypothetical protein